MSVIIIPTYNPDEKLLKLRDFLKKYYPNIKVKYNICI